MPPISIEVLSPEFTEIQGDSKSVSHTYVFYRDFNQTFEVWRDDPTYIYYGPGIVGNKRLSFTEPLSNPTPLEMDCYWKTNSTGWNYWTTVRIPIGYWRSMKLYCGQKDVMFQFRLRNTSNIKSYPGHATLRTSNW